MKLRKSGVLLDFLLTYGWAILVIFVVIAVLAYLGFPQNIQAPKEDIVIDSEPELLDVCNKLVVNNEVYPFLEVMGNGLKKSNGAEFVAYKIPSELRSNLDIFNVDKLILCGVPTELCYTENNNIKGGTYCLNWVLEVPVFIDDFNSWYENAKS